MYGIPGYDPNKTRKSNSGYMSAKDWLTCIIVGVLILAVVFFSLYGARELFIDTVHRSIH